MWGNHTRTDSEGGGERRYKSTIMKWWTVKINIGIPG